MSERPKMTAEELRQLLHTQVDLFCNALRCADDGTLADTVDVHQDRDVTRSDDGLGFLIHGDRLSVEVRYSDPLTSHFPLEKKST